MASTPVSSWTDTAVMQYNLHRWDHQLLKTHGFPMADYEKAREQFVRLAKRSKAEKKAANQATYLAEKRLLLTKLLELRAAAGQAMRKDPRIAGAAITAASEAAEKARVAMLKEAARSHKKMQQILAEQAEHLGEVGEVGKAMGAVEDDGDAGFAPATDGSDGEERVFVVTDGYELPGDAADTEPPAVPAAPPTTSAKQQRRQWQRQRRQRQRPRRQRRQRQRSLPARYATRQ